MRRMLAALGILSATFLSQTALAHEVFVIGPGMVGHPADDPSVGYSALVLEEKLGGPEGPAVQQGGAGQRPWEEAWFQLNQMPGV